MYGNLFIKVNCIIFANPLFKLQSPNFFSFILYCRLFFADVQAKEQPCVDGSPNPYFIRENNLKPI